MVLTEAVTKLKYAERFCKINAITPKYIIVIWEEEY